MVEDTFVRKRKEKRAFPLLFSHLIVSLRVLLKILTFGFSQINLENLSLNRIFDYRRRYFRSEKKRKTSISFDFLSLNRIFAAHYGDTCAFHANGISSVERESGANPEQCPLL